VEVHGNGEARRAENRSSKGEVLGEGIFPCSPARESGEHCSKLSSEVRGFRDMAI